MSFQFQNGLGSKKSIAFAPIIFAYSNNNNINLNQGLKKN